MSTPSPTEWAGLETFVQELRALEAPPSSAATPVSVPPDVPVSVISAPPARITTLRSAWVWRGGLAAAGVAAVLVVQVIRSSAPRPLAGAAARASSPNDTTRRAGGPSAPLTGSDTSAAPATPPRDPRLAFLSPWPAVAQAQEAPGAPAITPYPPLTGLDPSRLKAGQRTYVRLSANDYHASLPHQIWTNELDTVRYRGVPAFRLVRRIESRNLAGQSNNTNDTLWVRATDLRPLARRVSQASMFRQQASFTDSSMTEESRILPPPGVPAAMWRDAERRGMNTWRHTLTFRAGSPFIVSSEYLRLLLRAAPLSATWRASVQIDPHPYNQTDNAGFVNLRVAGVDTVQLFNGRYPAWRVVVEGRKRPETWYVSQQTGETLITDGPLDASYPESRSLLVYGVEETMKAPPVRRR